MAKHCFINIILLFNLTIVFGQTETKIKVPEFDDNYSKTVKILENGKTNIDYKSFRESFIESEQFKIASKNSSEFRNLKKEMYRQMSESKYDSIIITTKKMLSIDYTSMTAHKTLRRTYEILGDTINANKYKAIQFGLLMSIVNSGDGKSYIDNDGGICDRIEVVDENDKKKVYYFEISNVFKGRENLKNK